MEICINEANRIMLPKFISKLTSPPNYAPEIIAEQIRILTKNQVLIITATTIISASLYFPIIGSAKPWILYSWIGAIQLVNVYRLWVLFKYRNKTLSTNDLVKRRPIIIFNALISGFLWALAPPLFIPDNPSELTLLLSCIYICMSAGMVAPSLSIRAAVMCFTAPTILSLCYTIFMLPNSVLPYLSSVLVVYLAIIYITSGHAERTFLTSIQIRFEKEALLKELSEQKLAAEQANLTKSKFLAAASHDLRQPLHALSLYLDTAKQETDPQRQQELYLKMAIAMGALNDLFERLLDISKLDAGIIEPSLADSRIDDIFKRLEVRFTPMAKDKKLHLSFKHQNEIFYSDTLLLERILDNLIGNAIRYTASGKINIEAKRNNNEIIISVKDTGSGIPTHEQKNIFTEFYQLLNPERDRTKGLGLGLSIVKRLCELLQHELKLKSNDSGTTFSICVPIGDTKRLEAKQSIISRAVWDIKNTNILVIDDEINIQDAMKQLLCKWGCQVNCVGTIDEATQTIKNGNIPDLIIADYRLRNNETGVTAIKAVISAACKDIPGILITGDTAPERLQEASQSGFKLLHKPVNASKLRMVANHLLTKHTN